MFCSIKSILSWVIYSDIELIIDGWHKMELLITRLECLDIFTYCSASVLYLIFLKLHYKTINGTYCDMYRLSKMMRIVSGVFQGMQP